MAPPAIVINVAYPGASAQTLEDAVISVIEREMNGSPGMIYMESVSQANGTGQLTLTFETGTNADLAQVDVQNRLSRAAPRLPAAVTQQGVRVDKSRSNFLLFTILSSDNPDIDPIALGDFASRNVLPELQRLPGVGQAQLFGSERAMRIWIDPARLVGFNLSTAEVNAASGGAERPGLVRHHRRPAQPAGPVDLRHRGGEGSTDLGGGVRQHRAAREYRRLDGATQGRGAPRTRRAELCHFGASQRQSVHRHRRAALADRQRAGHGRSRAMRMEELSQILSAGRQLERYRTTVRGSCRSPSRQVVETLLEAVLLVFLVMYLFLQKFRYTIIPTLVVPIALMGTFAVLFALGFSINVLSMFGMVLVIGIVVDDAIVVVENVERIMSEEGLPPLQATRKAMGQISGAIVGVTVVLVVGVRAAGVFRRLGRQHLSPVLRGDGHLDPVLRVPRTVAHAGTVRDAAQAGREPAIITTKGGFFGWFNRGFTRTARGYESLLARILKRAARYLVIYVAIIVAVGVFYLRLPTRSCRPKTRATCW